MTSWKSPDKELPETGQWCLIHYFDEKLCKAFIEQAKYWRAQSYDEVNVAEYGGWYLCSDEGLQNFIEKDDVMYWLAIPSLRFQDMVRASKGLDKDDNLVDICPAFSKKENPKKKKGIFTR
jgi:hypothetical protein